MARYEEHAVQALLGVLASAQLTDQLRAVESAAGLSSGALTDPKAVVDAALPFDNRSPLIQVYDESGQMVDQLQGVYAVTCVVLLSYTGTADIVAGERFMRRYLTAIRDTLRANALLRYPLINDLPQVIGALLRGHDRATFGDESTTRHHRGVEVEVRINI